MQKVQSQLEQNDLKIKLADVKCKIILVKGFIEQGLTKSTVDDKIEKARANLESSKESKQSVFYKDEKKILPTTQSTMAYLDLSKYLQIKISMNDLTDDFEQDLNSLAKEELRLLEIISKNPDILNKSEKKS